jgi:hypothetical protein
MIQTRRADVKLNIVVINCNGKTFYGAIVLKLIAVTMAKRFMTQAPGANVIKLITVVMYCHFRVTFSFNVIKQNNCSN